MLVILGLSFFDDFFHSFKSRIFSFVQLTEEPYTHDWNFLTLVTGFFVACTVVEVNPVLLRKTPFK